MFFITWIAYLCFIFFSDFCLITLFESYPSALLFCLFVFVCIYYIDQICILALKVVALWPLMPSNILPLVTRTRCSSGVPFVSYMHPPTVAQPQLLRMPYLAGLALSLLSVKSTATAMYSLVDRISFWYSWVWSLVIVTMEAPVGGTSSPNPKAGIALEGASFAWGCPLNVMGLWWVSKLLLKGAWRSGQFSSMGPKENLC